MFDTLIAVPMPGQLSLFNPDIFNKQYMWNVVVTYTDRPARTFVHLDEHHSVKQYAAIAADMRDNPDSVHTGCQVVDDSGWLVRDTQADVWVPYQDDDQRIGGNDA